jgi:hypothetical protein
MLGGGLIVSHPRNRASQNRDSMWTTRPFLSFSFKEFYLKEVFEVEYPYGFGR